MNMTHIESRPSKIHAGSEYDFYVDCACAEQLKDQLVEKLKDISLRVNVLSREPNKEESTCVGRREKEGGGGEYGCGMCVVGAAFGILCYLLVLFWNLACVFLFYSYFYYVHACVFIVSWSSYLHALAEDQLY